MVEIVINYDKEKEVYKVFEPTSNTLLVSTNISQALIGLSDFLIKSGLEKNNILESPDISYHIDSATMRAMVESNFALLKRLSQAPTGFMMSQQRFGSTPQKSSSDGKSKNFGRSSSTFSHGSFNSSNRKFGGKS